MNTRNPLLFLKDSSFYLDSLGNASCTSDVTNESDACDFGVESAYSDFTGVKLKPSDYYERWQPEYRHIALYQKDNFKTYFVYLQNNYRI